MLNSNLAACILFSKFQQMPHKPFLIFYSEILQIRGGDKRFTSKMSPIKFLTKDKHPLIFLYVLLLYQNTPLATSAMQQFLYATETAFSLNSFSFFSSDVDGNEIKLESDVVDNKKSNALLKLDFFCLKLFCY